MAVPRKSTRYIGLCAVCMRYIKVRKGALVHHGFERPGYGHIVGDCFGVGYPPYEVSAEGARAWGDVVALKIDQVQKHLAALPGAEVLYEQTFSQGRYVPTPIRKAEVSAWKWNRLYESKERELQRELRSWEQERDRIQQMVRDWTAQPLTTVEEAVAEKKEAAEAKRTSQEEARRKKIEAKVEYYQKRKASMEKRLEKAKAKLEKSPSEKLSWDIRMMESDLERLPEDAVRKLRELSGFRQGKYGLSKEEALALLGWGEPPIQARKLKNRLLK